VRLDVRAKPRDHETRSLPTRGVTPSTEVLSGSDRRQAFVSNFTPYRHRCRRVLGVSSTLNVRSLQLLVRQLVVESNFDLSSVSFILIRRSSVESDSRSSFCVCVCGRCAFNRKNDFYVSRIRPVSNRLTQVVKGRLPRRRLRCFVTENRDPVTERKTMIENR
jgi:hypothetical protein